LGMSGSIARFRSIARETAQEAVETGLAPERHFGPPFPFLSPDALDLPAEGNLRCSGA